MEQLGLAVALRFVVDDRRGARPRCRCGRDGHPGRGGLEPRSGRGTGSACPRRRPRNFERDEQRRRRQRHADERKERPAPAVGSRPIVTSAAEPKSEAAAKKRAAGLPSQCHDSATPVGRSSANGDSTPPVSDIAQKSSARSATMASGAAKTPSDSCAPSRVSRKSDSSAPPIASASRRGSPSPSTIAIRAKRVKRPEAAAR